MADQKDEEKQLGENLQQKLSLGGGGGALKFNMNAPAFNPFAMDFVPGGPPTAVPEVAATPAVPAPVTMPKFTGPAKSFSIGGSKSTAAPAAAAVKKESPSASPPTTTKSSSDALAKAAAPKATAATPSKSASASKEPINSSASAESLPPVEKTQEEVQAEEEFFEDGKEHLNIVFIGHVDAGKSTMGGHILFLTGMVDKRTMEKYEREAKEQGRESWYLSWALDTNTEERAKGKTVECGKAFFETEKRRFTILDAPGHKNYVPNMISGASQADVGILVISARRGEFETGFERGGQTREHAMLAKTAGVKRLVVVINKMDDPTVEWAKERYDECCSKLLPFLKQCGYNPKVDLDFMPISGFTGANLKDRLTKDVCPWYDGQSLLEFLDTLTGIDRKTNGPVMMPLNEKYKDMGTIVAGKIESGRIRKGQNILIMPNKKVCEVLTVYAEQDDELKSAQCGDNVRLRLKGIEEEEIPKGSVLCDVAHPVKCVQSFEAQLMILEHKNIICAGYSAVLHVHSCVEEVTIGALLCLVDKKTNRRSKKPPVFVKKGQIVIARIDCTQPICVETYNDYQQLGRFTIRDEGKTVAMGKITKLLDSGDGAPETDGAAPGPTDGVTAGQ